MPEYASTAIPPLPRRVWWPWDQRAGRVGFARTFVLSAPVQASLYVSASGPYQAWLDGRLLPAPDAPLPSWRAMHRFMVELTPGEHDLRFEALPGDHGQPFLLACLDWPALDGTLARIATDAQWQMAADPPIGWATQPLEPGWRPAWAFDGVWAEPWGMPGNAPEDFCRLSHGWQAITSARLERVVRLHQGLATAGAAAWVRSGAALEMRPAHPLAAAPPYLENTRPCQQWYRTRKAHSQQLNLWLDLFETRAPHAVLDAGAETFARLRVQLRSGGPALLAVTTGESLPEVARYAGRVSDVFELQDGETFATTPTGFRYVKIMGLSSAGDTLLLEPIEIQHVLHDVAPRGSFSCSDPQLDALWALSARTVHLCMQNEIWDGIKRDQLPWMGDLYTEALAAYHVFGDGRLARRSLAVLGEIGPAPSRPLEEQRYPGLVATWKTAGGDINGIPSYTLWWVVGLADYLQYTGDRSLIAELADELTAMLDHVAGWVGEDNLWHSRAGWDYVDWAPVPAPERQIFCHLLACQVLALGADLLAACGRPDAPYRQLHGRMVQSARETWWRDGAGEFGSSHHVNAMAIRSGILSPEESAALFARTLAADPPYRMTYWHRYADLDAAARAGQVAWGLDYIRRHWGHALHIGMTALWEAFDATWIGDDPHAVAMIAAEHARYGGYETSLCHGWSAGPAIWLHTAVLGVRPAAPGFAAITFHPDLGDLEWAEGTVPTPHGPIRVALHRGRNGQTEVEVELPAAVRRTESPTRRDP